MRCVVDWTKLHSIEWSFDAFSAVKWSVGEYVSGCMLQVEWSMLTDMVSRRIVRWGRSV